MPKPEKQLEAIHLVALAIDAEQKRKRGDPDCEGAKKLADEAVKIWKKQFWERKSCPHCGGRL